MKNIYYLIIYLTSISISQGQGQGQGQSQVKGQGQGRSVGQAQGDTNSECLQPRERREWRQLTSNQQLDYLSAVTRLKNRQKSGSESSDPSQWNYDQFTEIHWKYQTANHGKPPFFPWHRYFIHGYEKALQSINPSITLPYWDWRLDSQNPAGSDLLDPTAFGGNGNATANNCLTEGVAANWISVSGSNAGQCLKRCSAWKALYSPESVAALLSQATDYKTFYTAIEGGPHAALHNQMGGPCGDFSGMASPNDPIFFLHHSMVDKLWWAWQTSCDNFAPLYTGSLSDPLPPYNIPVGQVMRATKNGLCYTYSLSQGDVPFTLKCASGQKKIGSVINDIKGGDGNQTEEDQATNPNIWLQNVIMSLVNVDAKSMAAVNINAANVTTHLSKRDLLSAVIDGAHQEREKVDAAKEVEKTSVPVKFIDAPLAVDNCDMNNLRKVPPLSDNYIKMMGLDQHEIRRTEEEANKVVTVINNTRNKTSIASLKYYNDFNKLGRWNRDMEDCSGPYPFV